MSKTTTPTRKVPRVQIMFTEPSLTKQSFKDECDVNNIVKKHSVTGIYTHINERSAQYADVTEIPDYQTAMQTVASANQLFGTLPSQLRKRFNNDPAEYLAFVQNEDNLDEMVRLGMAVPRPTPSEPSKTPDKAVSEPAPKEGS